MLVAMNQLNHMTSVITIIVYKVIKIFVVKMGF